ncbi:hypothetical protein KM043_007257 [Ampulex compressa]|nr:hypothetical protein KM043_007257 [Ampulex compressa]
MPGPVEHRLPTPLIKTLQIILRGRDGPSGLRYADKLAARTQPPPHVPGGPYHKTSKIYYYTRDARREVQPSLEIFSSKQITAGSTAVLKSESVSPAKAYLPQ